MTDLAVRMTLFTKGQLTWPEPDLNKKCIQCEHVQRVPKEELNQYVMGGADHRCALVKAHTKKKGVIFNPHKAIACPKFSC